MEAWLFPGQGSQRHGMGADLFGRFPDVVAEADEVLGYSLVDLCTGPDDGRLKDTAFVQPALFVVNALAYLTRREEHPEPNVLAGHSLGELDALWAAGCMGFASAVRLVARRGALMAAARTGTMAAVVGLDRDAVAGIVAQAGADVEVANDNSPAQVVVSGSPDGIAALRGPVRAAGARYVPLNVSAAFHSRFMADAAAAFAVDLAAVDFTAPRVPVVANVTAADYPSTGVGELLARQVTSPVRWRESMAALAARGVERVVEVGPGTVLTGLWKACAPGSPTTPAAPARPLPAASTSAVTASLPGSAAFRRDFGVRHAYLAGSMYRGIASTDMAIRLGRHGLMGFFGTGGLSLDRIEAAIATIRAALDGRAHTGMNLLATLDDPALEQATVDLFLRHDIRFVEAAAFTQMTAPLVQFRFTGAGRGPDGRPRAARRVVAKVSRPEVAAAFMRPPPAGLVDHLESTGRLTPGEAAVARELPVSEDVCVESDSAGHTDAGVALTLVPSMARLRDGIARDHPSAGAVRIGASGGLGSPEAVAAAFVLGADFVVTGSVNQCSPEAGTSAEVKDMLAALDVSDTTYAPAGDLFELGARVQVVRRGTMFAARANKLYQLYRQHGSLDDLGPKDRATVESTYFKRSLDDVWRETAERLAKQGREADVTKAEANPKLKMALVFRWYFAYSTEAAMAGRAADAVNFQVHCGPAMGAFNRFVAGTPLEDWRNRHVERIADALMDGAAEVLAGAARPKTLES